MDHRVDAVGGERRVGQAGERIDAQRQQVGQPRPDDPEGQPEHQPHDADEAGQGGVFAGEDLVNSHAPLVLPALAGAHHGALTELFNKGKAHIGQRGLPVQPGFLL